MGKAIRWLRALLGLKKEKEHVENPNPSPGDKKEKPRRSFSKPVKDSTGPVKPAVGVKKPGWEESYMAKSRAEQNKHAMACAAASAAAADAAVVAAQAAVAVVRLQHRGRKGSFVGGKEALAAVKIQNVFRGYLARKALRALKGLVKLQALVRGYLVRKRAAATFHSMQALIRAQSTVRSQRAHRSHLKHNTKSSKNSSQNFNKTDSETPKIVEIDTLIDTFKPRSKSRKSTTLSSEFRPYIPAMASPARFSGEGCFRKVEDLEWYLWPGTPAKSVSGEGYFRQFSNYPNYMANTESFKAKLRSHSAPKQRPESEIVGPRNSVSSVKMKRYCNGVGEDEDDDEEEVFDF